MSEATYKSAGVDLELYERAMARLPALMARTHAAQRSRVLPLPGGFAGLFRLNADDRRYDDPVLVSGTDGVGTKLKVAAKMGVHNTVGIDLVAMCVNDCLCLGAEPLFFLDYLALGRDDPDLIAALVEGVSEGCEQAQAALLGGETAIMPDLYAPGDFDLAGFCVGVVERNRIIDGQAIRPGDVLIGLASSGFHSNGYSLIRKVVFERAGLAVDSEIPDLQKTVGQILLEPTRIYARDVQAVLQSSGEPVVHGMAHITGGGLLENVSRILPSTCQARIRRGCWSVPQEFHWLQTLGNIQDDEMHRVYNMGVGFVLVIDPAAHEAVQDQLSDRQVVSWHLGEIAAGDGAAVYVE